MWIICTRNFHHSLKTSFSPSKQTAFFKYRIILQTVIKFFSGLSSCMDIDYFISFIRWWKKSIKIRYWWKITCYWKTEIEPKRRRLTSHESSWKKDWFNLAPRNSSSLFSQDLTQVIHLIFGLDVVVFGPWKWSYEFIQVLRHNSDEWNCIQNYHAGLIQWRTFVRLNICTLESF